MTTDVIPILHVADAGVATEWYRRLGFTVNFEHRFGPEFPWYVGLRREGAQLHLSEHAGDATPDTLVYVWVDDVASIATDLGVDITEQPWAKEVELTDPDGNRLRIGQALATELDAQYGEGTTATLDELERAMWHPTTRGDRAWMEHHLADSFVEFGYSGRAFGREDILAVEVDAIDATLHDLAFHPLGRDAVLVTYRSEQPRGAAHRSSIWLRTDGRWRLAMHQGTPAASTAP